MLSDILPTGYEIGVQYGDVKEGDVVAVIGAGPIGLAAIMTAAPRGASKVIAVDANAFRLEQSKLFGATDTIDISKTEDVVGEPEEARAATDSASTSPSRQSAYRRPSRRPSTRSARVGASPTSASTAHRRASRSSVTGSTTSPSRPVSSTRPPPRTCSSRSSAARSTRASSITHRFTFDQIMEAYDTFANAADQKALKVIITNHGPINALRFDVSLRRPMPRANTSNRERVRPDALVRAARAPTIDGPVPGQQPPADSAVRVRVNASGPSSSVKT